MIATPDRTWQQNELLACAADFAYWCRRYVYIYDAAVGDWVLFDLWPEQVKVFNLIEWHQLTLFLKARQLGLTWLVLAYILHGLLFKPIFEALIFSKREDEAFYLLGEERLKGMYARLPGWMQARVVQVDSASQLRLSNGSGVRAFPSNAGDSYTATCAFIDEADLVPDLGRLLRSVKPTIDAGGKLVMVSRADKSRPESPFKRIYRAARDERNEWRTMFLPWSVRPERDAAWYDAQRRDFLSNTGTLDDLWEQYPETDEQALAARTLDKRIPPAWIEGCFEARASLPLEDLPEGAPNVPGLHVYSLPEEDADYVIGVDPAEGNPTSDDSAFHVLRRDTNEEVAMLAGKFEPAVLAAHVDSVGRWFNRAAVMCERNNHGHAVLLWLRDHSPLKRLVGLDKREGWLSSTLGKAQLYDNAANAFKEGMALIHTRKTFDQLRSIEGSSLRAPEGQMDDCADSYALALTHMVARIRVGNIQLLKRGEG